MLAFMMNGELLHPDHGYPVRLLMPGFIGGRMIKWLKKITVTKDEGDSHYHIYDNRVFPKHITSKDEATKHKIWADPAYRIDDRNINSAIWAPAHCEKVSTSNSTFSVGGYAYNGAGRPIHRVEVTLNDGHTWMPAEIHRFEKPNQYGMVYFGCTGPARCLSRISGTAPSSRSARGTIRRTASRRGPPGT
jgi:nitrate reductase (NAD(P)H)